MELTNNDLKMVRASGYGIFVSIGSAVAFLIGIIDGFVNPSGCKK